MLEIVALVILVTSIVNLIVYSKPYNMLSEKRRRSLTILYGNYCKKEEKKGRMPAARNEEEYLPVLKSQSLKNFIISLIAVVLIETLSIMFIWGGILG